MLAAPGYALTPTPVVTPSRTASVTPMVKKSSRKALMPTPTVTAEILAEEADDEEEVSRYRWVAPASADECRLIRCAVNAAYQGDGRPDGEAISLFDLAVSKRFGNDSATGEGWVRFSKGASTGDRADVLELRVARVTYSEPWIQCQAGRFDLFPHMTPNSFFGAYPLMGMRRVDGVLVILPAFFKFGVRDDKSYTMPPASISLFYSPTFFPDGATRIDQTQSYGAAQARFRASIGDVQVGFRANYAKSRETWFAYSAFSGVPAYSLALEAVVRRDYSATVEYGVQNVCRWRKTNVVSAGLRAVRVATFGPFSIDDVVLEGQLPVARAGSNPFTGGNDLRPPLGRIPQGAWYARVKTRLKALILEFHVTNNQDDFTLGRLVQEATYMHLDGLFGPGLEAEGLGVPFRSRSYKDPSYLMRVGVEF